MCPPLTNDTWVYGSDDDTLFRLIALGTDYLVKEGYARVKHEDVTGPMPPFGGIIKTSNDLWRIIAFIRSVNAPRSRVGFAAEQASSLVSACDAVAQRRCDDRIELHAPRFRGEHAKKRTVLVDNASRRVGQRDTGDNAVQQRCESVATDSERA